MKRETCAASVYRLTSTRVNWAYVAFLGAKARAKLVHVKSYGNHPDLDLTVVTRASIPQVYDEHYKLAIYITPSRCDDEVCNAARVRLPASETLPCRQPLGMPSGFLDSSVPKNQRLNFTILALEDVLLKVRTSRSFMETWCGKIWNGADAKANLQATRSSSTYRY